MIPKLSRVYYTVRPLFHISDTDFLRSIYFISFHSTMKYRIILGGKSSKSKMLFTLQKKIVRIMNDAKPRNSYRSLIKRL
jgi:hypothetical protein